MTKLKIPVLKVPSYYVLCATLATAFWFWIDTPADAGFWGRIRLILEPLFGWILTFVILLVVLSELTGDKMRPDK